MPLFPDIPEELIRRLDVAAPRYTSYPTVPVWSETFGAADYAKALALAGRRCSPLSLYVHIPFCREMCTYCGCNVVVTKDPAKADRYLRALNEEVTLVTDRLGSRRGLSRVHLGGGTPTFLTERQLLALWRRITDSFSLTRDAETSVEIDPVVTRPEQLALLRGLGFRRLSLGVQDFDPAVQRAVNRKQTFEETRATLEYARDVAFESINVDLIYGLPMQTPESWRRTLEQVLLLRPDRISLFSFAYVPEVKPHQRKLDVAHLPSGAAKLHLFRLAHDAFAEVGYLAIGMDHFALPDDELAWAQERRQLWRDFQGYSVQGARDTVALGVSGISSLGGAYVQNAKSLPRYEQAVSEGWLPVERGHWCSAGDCRRRAVIQELMCNFCVDLGPGAEHFAREWEDLRQYEHDGLVTLEGTRVTVTPLGRVFLRNVASVFDVYLRRDTTRPLFSRTV